MNIQEIIKTRENLEKELRLALASMEKKETIFMIKKKIDENQFNCPHFDLTLNFSQIDNHCPYCGKDLGRN